MLKKMFLFCFLLLNLNATDTNLSFDSSKIETKAPKIELSLSSLYQNADEVVKGVIYILVLFSILAFEYSFCFYNLYMSLFDFVVD